MATEHDMPRPTRAELQLAKMVARPGADIGPNVACVLAAEVSALERDLQSALAQTTKLECKLPETEAERMHCSRVAAEQTVLWPEMAEEVRDYTPVRLDVGELRALLLSERAAACAPLLEELRALLSAAEEAEDRLGSGEPCFPSETPRAQLIGAIARVRLRLGLELSDQLKLNLPDDWMAYTPSGYNPPEE